MIPPSTHWAAQWLARRASLLLVIAWSASYASETAYGPPESIGHVEHDDLVESSGLAASFRHGGNGDDGTGGEILWTHNDSGDEPRIFAFDSLGRHRGICQLMGAEAIDWEDLGSFTLRGRPYLYVADVGDNAKKREHCTIYLIAEPELGETSASARGLRFTYEDGPLDCEAVALDRTQQVFILVEKAHVPAFPTRVYQLPWKSRPEDGRRVAKRIGSLRRGHFPVPWVTGMDISSDGRRAVLATYSSLGLEYHRQADENWQEAFAKPPREILLPGVGERRQGESIAYGRDGITLYLTSERHPCPLFVIRPQGQSSEP
jgi:hypothetical protein